MYSKITSSPPYHLTSLKPGSKLGLGAFGIGVISFLTMLVLGILLVAFVPQTGNSTSAASKVPLKIDKDPAAVSLAEFKNGYAPVIDPALPAVVRRSGNTA
jgi:hypothetical protein